jgi:protein N-terminal methyltransferase
MFLQFRVSLLTHTCYRIGRIAEGLLLSISETVDIVEPMAKFTDSLRGKEGVGVIFNVGLEDWDIDGHVADESMKYDLIWNQWCLGHLTDAQLEEYLKKCSRALNSRGWIIVKENLSTSDRDIFDDLDNSVTRYSSLDCIKCSSCMNSANMRNRLDEKFREIFQKAGLQIRKTELQKGMKGLYPSMGLYPVRTYALQPLAL